MSPVADTETQSSVDASLLNHMVMDIDMVFAFVGENDLSPAFYTVAPGAPAPTPPQRNTSNQYLTVIYNNTPCMDGIVRDGSLYMKYTDAPNVNYYRDPGYKANMFNNGFYKVDGWSIRVPDGKFFTVTNNMQVGFDPSKTPLSWTIEGSLEFIHPTDPSKNMSWNGKLVKTLVNTEDHAVYNPSGAEMIHWSKAIVAYTGVVTGFTSADVPYKLEIDTYHPLTRDFTCYPDRVAGVLSTQPLKTWAEEFHPVKSGIATFTTDDKYPRQIYYGNEGNPELPAQCDNKGEVLIKGNTYAVDFKK